MNNTKQTLPEGIQKFRLGIYMGDFTQPISLMRCIGPLAAMQREEPRLELVFPQPSAGGVDIGWAWLARCDALFYSHPTTDTDLSVLWLARTMGIPVWSEYVDDVFNVEPTNPHYQAVKNKRALREAVTQAIEWSDVCTAVSGTCAKAYPHPERFAVIPEAAFFEPNDLPRRKCVTWRGLCSHAGDVETVLAELCAVAKDFPDWEWALMGEPTEEFLAQLTEVAGTNPDTKKSRVRVAPYYSTPYHAFEAWKGCAPYLHLVPLADNEFNRSKSHLAWLEASAVGAAVIVPEHLPEWQQPGVITYNSKLKIKNENGESFGEVLRRELVNYPHNGKLHPNVAVARAAIYPDLTLDAMNQRRWAVLRKLAKVGNRELRVESSGDRGNGTTHHSLFTTRSQAGQDRFVYELLIRGRRAEDGAPYRGTFLDIGSNDPNEINNTIALEELGWRGLLMDLDEKWAEPTRRGRKSPFVHADAATMDWTATLDKLPALGREPLRNELIDYLSLDVDEATLDALRNLLISGVRFRVATIEHDAYRFGEARKQALRALMLAHGYTLLAADVCLNEHRVPFEDWYVDAARVDMSVAEKFRSEGKPWRELFESAECGVRSAEVLTT